LKKIHRGIAFHQENFIRPFVEKCTMMRAAATTKSEQNMWKLVCNAFYGKVREKKSAKNIFCGRWDSNLCVCCLKN
jgi:hypothetical protein